MTRTLITTIPFAERDATPLHLLESAGIEYTINPLGRKVTEMELAELIAKFDILIAGTESITERGMAQAPKLKLISPNDNRNSMHSAVVVLHYAGRVVKPSVLSKLARNMCCRGNGRHHAPPTSVFTPAAPQAFLSSWSSPMYRLINSGLLVI